MIFPPSLNSTSDRIVIAGGSRCTLDLLRLATIRTDGVILIAPDPDAAVLRFAERFAIEFQDRAARDSDVEAASAVLIAIGDPQAENRLVRAARRHRVPVHVAGRELVSDFRMLDLFERPALAA